MLHLPEVAHAALSMDINFPCPLGFEFSRCQCDARTRPRCAPTWCGRSWSRCWQTWRRRWRRRRRFLGGLAWGGGACMPALVCLGIGGPHAFRCHARLRFLVPSTLLGLSARTDCPPDGSACGDEVYSPSHCSRRTPQVSAGAFAGRMNQVWAVRSTVDPFLDIARSSFNRLTGAATACHRPCHVPDTSA